MTSPLPRQTVMSHFARTAIAFVVLISSAMATDPLHDISTYTVCAGENQSFALSQVCDVAYGADGVFVFKAAQSGTVDFTNATFGDPVPGVAKSGYYRLAAAPVPPALNDISTYAVCAGENQSFALSQVCDVAYGANGVFVFKAAQSGTVDFTNATFGDPVPGVAKSGYYRLAAAPVPPALNDISTYTVCAGENQSFALSQVCDVAYGADGVFVFKAAQSGTVDFNNATFGDPVPGVAKFGYYRIAAGFPVSPVVGTGLTGDYRTIADVPGSPLRRLDPIINFPWGDGSPAASIAADHFTVRWTGQIQTRFDGDCTLSIISDDGVRLYLDGKLAIDDWTLHGDKENTYTFASQAGQKHDIRIEYFEFGGGASLYLKWQSANEPYALVPTSCLYPYDMANAIPASSAVSPAFLEGFYGATVPSVNTGTLNDLGASRFYANIPLSATANTPVTLTEGGKTASGSIAWTPTVLTNSQTIVVRPGDALLLRAENEGMLTIHKNYAAFRASDPIAAGQAIPVTFPEPGTYTIFEDDAAGNRVIEMTVRVPGVVAEDTPIACAVDYTRVKDITVVGAADKDLITWAASDPWIQLTPVMIENAPATQVPFTLKPTENRAAWLTGRINGETGAILANMAVRPFVLQSDSQKAMYTEMVYPDGSVLGRIDLSMTPIVPGLDVKIFAWVSGVTFDDSTTIRWVTSNDFTSNKGQGIYRFRLLLAPSGNANACHWYVAYDKGVQVSP